MEKKRECICFAYFVDDLFIGWYGDSFGTVSKYPKIYGNSDAQVSTIKTNFNYKMTRINETSFSKELAKIPDDGKEHIEVLRLIIFQDEKALKGRKVELKMVACPLYDGPNPGFDREAWKKIIESQTELKKELGIHNLPAGSMQRMKALQAFEKENPEPKYNGWIYATAEEVKLWAEVEPTEFLKIIKFNSESKSVKNVEPDEETETGESEITDDSTEEM